MSLMIPKHEFELVLCGDEFELVLCGDVGFVGLNTGKWSPMPSEKCQKDDLGVVGGWSSLEFLLSGSTVSKKIS